jgi:hypothetical protein
MQMKGFNDMSGVYRNGAIVVASRQPESTYKQKQRLLLPLQHVSVSLSSLEGILIVSLKFEAITGVMCFLFVSLRQRGQLV